MRTATTTYTVCARKLDGPWEVACDGLESFGDAEAWLRRNFDRWPECTAWYVDRDDNEGRAESCWDVRDGSLVWTN